MLPCREIGVNEPLVLPMNSSRKIHAFAARGGPRQPSRLPIALAALVAVLAAFCAGAQSSTEMVQWRAGNGYPAGPYSSPNAACATVLNGLRGPAEGWGPNAYYLYSNAVANPAGWDITPIGGYPYSATYCNYTETIYDCGASCPHVTQITNGLPYVYAISPPATCLSATCPVSPKEAGESCPNGKGCTGADMRVGEYKCSELTEYFYGKPPDIRIAQFVAADLKKQYAIYLCANQYLEPPATYLAEPFALEGGRIVGFLKDKLSRATDDGTIRDVVLVFIEMSRQRTYNVGDDGKLMKVVDDRVAAMKDKNWKRLVEERVKEIRANRSAE